MRTLFIGAGAAVVALGPVVVPAGVSEESAIAQPCGGVNITVLQEGVPVTANCGPGQAPVSTGGAPSQDILSWCSGIPGCLSNILYGPGNVQVPQRDTTVRQSQ